MSSETWGVLRFLGGTACSSSLGGCPIRRRRFRRLARGAGRTMVCGNVRARGSAGRERTSAPGRIRRSVIASPEQRHHRGAAGHASGARASRCPGAGVQGAGTRQNARATARANARPASAAAPRAPRPRSPAACRGIGASLRCGSPRTKTTDRRASGGSAEIPASPSSSRSAGTSS